MLEFLGGVFVGICLTIGGMVWLSMMAGQAPGVDPLFPSKGPPKQ